jgi:heme exporter protein C
MRDRLARPLGLITLLCFAVGLYFAFSSPPDVNQGNLIRILYVHVPSAWFSYVAYTGTFVYSLIYLLSRKRKYDRLAAASTEIGVLMTVLTLYTGSLWGRPTWGVYWVWDPRLTTTALALLIYLGYFVVRGLIDDPGRRGRVAAVIAIIGTLDIPVNYMSVYWWRSIHQTPTFQLIGGVRVSAAAPMVEALLVMLLAYTLLYFYLLRLRGRLAELVETREERELESELQGDLKGGMREPQ